MTMGLFKKITGFILGGGDKLTLPTADGSASQVLKTDGAGNLDWVAQSGGSPVFGTEYTYAARLFLTATSNTIYEEVVNLTTVSIPAGNYYISWWYPWSYDALQRDFMARVQLDNATNLMYHQEEPQDADFYTQKVLAGGFAVVPLALGVHTVDLDFRTSSSSDAARIPRAHLILYRVS